MPVQTRLSMLSGTALVVALAAVGVAPVARAESLALTLRPTFAAAVPTPPRTVIPASVDIKTPYQGQVSCDPRPKPGVTAFSALMKARYKSGVVGTYRPCLGDVSEHYDGRALDWMLNVTNPAQKAIANSVVVWLSANGGVVARRFGISYIIWNHKVWKEYRPERGWTVYTGAVPHTDHIHVSFSWNGAMKRTSWWTANPIKVVDVGPCRVTTGQFAPLYRAIRTAPCPSTLTAPAVSPYKVAVFGQRSTQIAVAQRLLGVTASGLFGSATFSKLVTWQGRARVPVTGVLDKATWARLVRGPVPAVPKAVPSPIVAPAPSRSAATTQFTASKRVVLRLGSRGAAVVVLQRGLKITADGAFGPKTRTALVGFQTRQRLVRNGLAARAVWDRLERLYYPLVAYRGVTLRLGSRGSAVAVVQRVLRLTADGSFGPRTGAGVKVVQAGARLARTGVVSGWTWVAIENQMRRQPR